MTNVYGVTFIGGRDQISKQLRANDQLAKQEIYDSAHYLTMCVFQSIGEMFTAAQAIQVRVIHSHQYLTHYVPIKS